MVHNFGLDHTFSVDLADMSKLPDKGYKFILCMLDNFSKYGYVVALKNRTN